MERVSRPRPAQGTRTQGHATSAPPNVPRKPTTAFDFWFALQLKEMNIERLFSPDSLKKEKPGIAKMGFSFTAASFPFLSSSPTFVASDLPESTLTPSSGPLHCDLLNRNA